MTTVLLGAPSWEDDGAPAEASALDVVTWSGVLPFSPLRELKDSTGIRLRLKYDPWSQLATWSLFNPMTFAEGAAAYAAAAVKESGGGLRVAARAFVRDDDDVAYVDLVPTGTTPTNISVRELFARVDRGAFACQLTGVSRVPSMSDSERAASLTKERDASNAAPSTDGGTNVVGVPKPPPGFLGEFGKYAGIVVGLGALVAAAYVVRSLK